MDEFTKIFGLSTKEEGILPVERWPLARILNGEKLRDWEVNVRRPDRGWEKVFSYGGTLAQDRDGQPMLAVVTVADVTERKRAKEAMNNIAKHSQASFVNLSLRKEDGKILLAIQDNGQGFDLNTVRKGLGLSTMRERAQLAGGAFALESTVGKGL